MQYIDYSMHAMAKLCKLDLSLLLHAPRCACNRSCTSTKLNHEMLEDRQSVKNGPVIILYGVIENAEYFTDQSVLHYSDQL